MWNKSAQHVAGDFQSTNNFIWDIKELLQSKRCTVSELVNVFDIDLHPNVIQNRWFCRKRSPLWTDKLHAALLIAVARSKLGNRIGPFARFNRLKCFWARVILISFEFDWPFRLKFNFHHRNTIFLASPKAFPTSHFEVPSLCCQTLSLFLSHLRFFFSLFCAWLVVR